MSFSWISRIESLLYVMVVPILLNSYIFMSFSWISRLSIPCLPATSDKGDFSLTEAFSVGIFYPLIQNSFSFILLLGMFQDADALKVLFFFMLVAPSLASSVFLVLFYK